MTRLNLKRKPKKTSVFICLECAGEFMAVVDSGRKYCSPECYRNASVRFRKSNSNNLFWTRVEKTEGCWLWKLKPSTKFGYCRFNKTLAHRKAWEIEYGSIPSGMIVCHKCDNPRCVRPDHLFLGTQKDNVRDMYQKGRAVQNPLKGERCHWATIRNADVIEIKNLYGSGMSQRHIAKKFGVSPAQVSRIVNGKSRVSA